MVGRDVAEKKAMTSGFRAILQVNAIGYFFKQKDQKIVSLKAHIAHLTQSIS